MYCDYFGFQAKPFSSIIPANWGYLSASHQRLLGRLIHNINKKTGVIVLLGPAGVGKTIFLKQLVIDCEEINNIVIRDLSFCLRSVQLSTYALNNAAVVLDTTLVNNNLSGSNNPYLKTIYLLDHADRVDNDILEKILMTVSERNKAQKDTLLILVGLPNLASQLTHLQFQPYKFLLNDYFTLEYFNLREIENYITHRLKLAKYVGKTIFTDDAIHRIAELSQGIPQVINTLCSNSLSQASLDKHNIVTKETVNMAAEFCALAQESVKEAEVRSKNIPSVAFSEPEQTAYNEVLKLPELFPPDQTLQQFYQTTGEWRQQAKNSVKPIFKSRHSIFEAGSNKNNSHQGYKIALAATMMLSITAMIWTVTAPQLITQDSYNIADSGIVERSHLDNEIKLTLLRKQIASPAMSQPSILNNTASRVAGVNTSLPKPVSKIKASTVIKVTDIALEARRNSTLNQNVASDKSATSVKVAQVQDRGTQFVVPHIDNLLDQQELATKTRSAARYQLAEKGISYDFQNFFDTVENGDETVLNLFLAANMPVDIQEHSHQNTALITAAAHGHLNVVTTILDKKPAVNKQNKNGQTALISATTNGHYEVSRSLLINGADVHIRDNKGWDALMFAAEQNQVEIVKELLHYGANKNTRDLVGQTALSIAKNKSHFEIVALLQTAH